MSFEVRLPDLGESVTHARLSTWLKREGDAIKAGEPIAEVETDKTNLEIEAPGSGTLLRIHVGEGTDDIAVNTLLAVIGAGEGVTAAAATAADPAPERAGDDGLRTGQTEAERQSPSAGATPPDVAAAAVAAPIAVPAPETDAPAANDRIAATPLARRMAAAANIPLNRIVGTGPSGRITKQDVDGLLRPIERAPKPPEPAAAVAVAAAVGQGQNYREQALSAMRRITAERLTHAKQTIPHFYLQADCQVDRLAALRSELNARPDVQLSLTAFAIRAAVLALIRVPTINASWVDGKLRVYTSVDVAVAVETPGGLIAPVIRAAERKSVSMVNDELRLLAERARAGKLRPEDYSGGTFTLSNLGMYGVSGIIPIVNPPQTCILGLGAVEPRPIVRDGVVVAGAVMTCTVSADHRAIDGATGARFLAAFRSLIEDPWALML